MQKIILQVPVDKQLKYNAEKVATKQGFSSLQEIVRVFLSQLASNRIEFNLQNTVALSSKNDQRYGDMTADFEQEKNVESASGVEHLLSQLNADQVS